jgi:hypothetical protein
MFLLVGVVLTLGLGLSSCLSLDLNSLIFGKEDTSINWVMTEITAAPSMNKLESLKNTGKEASAIYRYANRAHAKENQWYKFTAQEKPGETFYAYKNKVGNNYQWEIYRSK